jgi:tRNA(Ile)-lysidine synthase
MDILDRVRKTIRQHDLARPESRVVVALSGGSDSVALAYLLEALSKRGELVVAGAAHFNHQLRDAADSDEQFCAQIAKELAWPFLADREDVGHRARRNRISVETAGRTARHEFFLRALAHFAADAVALGHTRDDQAETFLLRTLRGAGARGLASMHPRRAHLIRPLLDCRRAELRAYLDARGISWTQDASNDDLRIPRNRVRHELLPLLERRFNPSVVDVLADQADIAREEWRWMSAEAERLAADICHEDADGWRIDVQGLRALPVALARVLIRRSLASVSDERAVSFEHVEQVRELACSSGGVLDLPGCRAKRSGGGIVLMSRSNASRVEARPAAANLFSYPLSIPGEVRVIESGWRVSAELERAGESGVRGGLSGATVMVRLDRCGAQLGVRARRPGDRFRPVGMAGRKKLQDYFVDRKVPRDRRDRVPVVVDEFDRIVWVAGHAIDEEFRVTDPAQAVLILRLKPLGGVA